MVACSKIDNKFRMVALDLDGTTLQSNQVLADVQAEYLRSLTRRGFRVCIATGRSASSVYELVQQLNIPEPLPVVCSNGAEGFHIDAKSMKKKDIFYQPVSIEIFKMTVELANQHDFAVQFYHDDNIYVNSSEPKHLKFTQKYTEITGSRIESVDKNFEQLLSQGILPSKLLVYFEPEDHDLAFTEFHSNLSAHASVVDGTYPWFLEVLNPQVTKGYGLQEMCRHLSVPIEQCIAMGDGVNDVEFLSLAGLGLAMKNAQIDAKNAANQVLEWTNDENGVMKAMEELEKQGKLHLEYEEDTASSQ